MYKGWGGRVVSSLPSLTFFNISYGSKPNGLVIFNYTNLNNHIMTKVTKGAIAEFVRAKLKTNEKWQLAAMLKIYDLQTEDEKAMGDTCKYNGVGFSGAHGEIMSSLAVQYQRKGWLSPKQKAIVAKIIHKYTRQVIMISDISKLETLVINQ